MSTWAVIEAFAGSATEWFDAALYATEQRYQHLLQTEDSQPAYEAAATALQDARAKLNRLQMLVPWGSDVGRRAEAAVSSLEPAVAELEDWPPQTASDNGQDADNQHDDSDLPEGDRWDPVITPIEDAYLEAKMWHGFGLKAFAAFIEAAAEETGRGYLPLPRVATRLATLPFRRLKRWRTDRDLTRRRAAIESRTRESRRPSRP